MRLLVFLLMAILINEVSADEQALSQNESFILADAGIHRMTFEELNSGEIFVIRGLKLPSTQQFEGSQANEKHLPKLVKVKTGKYYLKSITPAFSNIGVRRFKKTECDGCFFLLQPGAVSYLGRWNVDLEYKSRNKVEWHIQRQYSYENLITLKQKNTKLTELPLFVANEEGKVLKIDWKEL